MLFELPYVTVCVCPKDMPIAQTLGPSDRQALAAHAEFFQLEEVSKMAEDRRSGELMFYTSERRIGALSSWVRKDGVSLRFYSGGFIKTCYRPD